MNRERYKNNCQKREIEVKSLVNLILKRTANLKRNKIKIKAERENMKQKKVSNKKWKIIQTRSISTSTTPL